MSKQAEILEGIALLINLQASDKVKRTIANAIILYLHSRGMVIMTGVLPSIFDAEDNVISVLEYREKVAGLFEPLIKRQLSPRDTSY